MGSNLLRSILLNSSTRNLCVPAGSNEPAHNTSLAGAPSLCALTPSNRPPRPADPQSEFACDELFVPKPRTRAGSTFVISSTTCLS